jgi:hypothetical protein
VSENMQHAFLTGLCKVPIINSKKIIDSSTGKEYAGVAEAAKE